MALPDSQTPHLRSQLPGYTSIVAGHVAKAPRVAYLELARPAKHNCFHEALWEEFPRAVRELDQHQDTRVIVVAAQGANFCAGIDCPGTQRAAMRRNILVLQAAYTALEEAACPVLAAVHAPAAHSGTRGGHGPRAHGAHGGRGGGAPPGPGQ
eukprot:XP_001698610.1 predicted protein [Chlamydomonas reinhardtii]